MCTEEITLGGFHSRFHTKPGEDRTNLRGAPDTSCSLFEATSHSVFCLSLTRNCYRPLPSLQGQTGEQMPSKQGQPEPQSLVLSSHLCCPHIPPAFPEATGPYLRVPWCLAGWGHGISETHIGEVGQLLSSLVSWREKQQGRLS